MLNTHEPPSTSPRTILSLVGYEITTRSVVECVVVLGDDRWRGVGDDEDAALRDVLAKMLPSELARRAGVLAKLLPHELVVVPALGAPVPAPPPAPPSPRPAPEPAPACPTREAPASPAPSRPAPEPLRPSAAAAASPAPPPAASPAARPVPSPASPQIPVEALLDEVRALEASVERQVSRLARLAPERQRLAILHIICSARAVEERRADPQIERAVGRLARRLGELCKLLWPGSVRPLALDATPGEVLRELPPVGGVPARALPIPQSWGAASRLVQDAANAAGRGGPASVLDDDGWADAGALEPRPTRPDEVLADATRTIGQTVHKEELGDTEVATLVRAAQRLRWIRGAVTDDIAWGTALGHLRRACQHLRTGQDLRNALDPHYRPGASWATLCEPSSFPPSAGKAPAPVQQQGRLAAELHDAAAADGTLLDWMVRAVDAFSGPELAALLEPHAGAVARLGLGSLTTSDQPDRRIRRRLKDVSDRVLVPSTPAPPASGEREVQPEAEATPGDADVGDVPPHVLAPLAARLRQDFEGRSVLVVSNREDPDLARRLRETLGVVVTWCDGGKTRLVQAQCERIQRDAYVLVLCCTGFATHGCDTRLAQAARARGVRYIRVNRGRPVACLLAIARELGMDQDQARRPAEVAAVA
jgi:hypothetical protein